MFTAIRLLVGLGNPGQKYLNTRHNAGEDWLRALAQRFNIELKLSSPMHGFVGRGIVADRDVRLLVPTTYMNNSGQAVGPLARYYRITPAEILVAYDDVAFEAGIARLKFGGGYNGHNGIKSIVEALGGSRDFGRLRIGVGHPGDPEKMTPYLIKGRASSTDRELIEAGSYLNTELLGWLLTGDWQRAMTSLHTKTTNDDVCDT